MKKYFRNWTNKKNPFTSQHVTLTRRNDLRKVLDESDDVLGDIETTKSTTTTSTTTPSTTRSTTTTTRTTTMSTSKSTTTQQRSTKRYYAPSKSPVDIVKTAKTYFSNSFYHNNNPNNINEKTDTKSPFKTVTQKAQVDTTELPSSPPAPSKATINPFYYGLNRVTQNTTTQRSFRQLQFSTTNRTPYSFQYYTPTKKPDLLAPTSQSTNDEIDNNYYESQSPPKEKVETEKPKSSTYNPVFDIYFKQIGRQRTTTTKNPFASS